VADTLKKKVKPEKTKKSIMSDKRKTRSIVKKQGKVRATLQGAKKGRKNKKGKKTPVVTTTTTEDGSVTLIIDERGKMTPADQTQMTSFTLTSTGTAAGDDIQLLTTLLAHGASKAAAGAAVRARREAVVIAMMEEFPSYPRTKQDTILADMRAIGPDVAKLADTLEGMRR
jgi:hypothetical protein